jgi:tetratricopeptide (TPR) repeat protein
VNIGDFQTGIGYLERSLDVNLQNRSAHHLGMNYLMMADAYKKKGDYEIAKDYCRLAQNELHSANIFSYDNDIKQIKQEVQQQCSKSS